VRSNKKINPLPTPPAADPPPSLPPNLNERELNKVKQLLAAERARSYLWEYRYLNYFLVYISFSFADLLEITPKGREYIG